jgi:hypothetical protein
VELESLPGNTRRRQFEALTSNPLQQQAFQVFRLGHRHHQRMIRARGQPLQQPGVDAGINDSAGNDLLKQVGADRPGA